MVASNLRPAACLLLLVSLPTWADDKDDLRATTIHYSRFNDPAIRIDAQ
jgi:hypothetical protein